MKLMILDGNSIINRAFYGVGYLSSQSGQPTGAIYGFLNIMQSLLDEEKPEALAVAFDEKGPTFRHTAYEGYKATRKPMPDDLASQMPILKEILSAMHIPTYSLQGWEADDILGTAGRICGENGWDCVVVTGDRDSLQLVDNHVTVKLVTTKAGRTRSVNYTPTVFQEEYGFPPKGLIDLKALMGDSSDNYPGVPGVGEKTAKDLMSKFGTLDNVYAHAQDEDLKPALRRKLQEGKDSAYQSYDLATIRCNAPVEFVPQDNIMQPWDRSKVLELFRRLNFGRLIDKYRLLEAELPELHVDLPALDIRGLETPEDLDAFLALLPGSGPLFISANADLTAMAVSLNNAVYTAEQGILGLMDWERLLDGVFAPETRKIVHDCKSMMTQLLRQGRSIQGFAYDTALAAYLLEPARSGYALGDLMERYCGASISDGLAGEAAAIAQLYTVLPEQVKQAGMEQVYWDIDFPLCPVLAEMEHAGILVDRDTLTAFEQMLSQRISDCENLIYGYAGGPFNINSTKQLGTLLFETLELPHGKKTKTGYSTAADVLDKLAPEYPIVADILEYRQLTKLKSTYADGLANYIKEDGRIHTSFNQTITVTGRLSSTEPNLQNIPMRIELGRLIRKAFLPAKGCVFMDADYSQIELRVLAHMSGDEKLIEAYREAQDIHRITASQVFHIPFDEVTDLQRRNAKAVNFGIVYGISSFGLSQDLSISKKEAAEYIERYFETYPKIKTFLDGLVEDAKKNGYVTTMFGRRRPVPELSSSNFMQRSFGERVAMNAPIQGTAADIIKIAMIRVHDRLLEEHLKSRLIITVHDELLIETAEDEIDRVKEILTEGMQHAADLKVALAIDLHTGKNWYEAK